MFLDTPEWKPLPEETFVWIVTKTGLDGGGNQAAALIQLLSRSAGGAWTTRTVSNVADKNTRPQLLISDTTPRVAYVLMTSPNGIVRKTPCASKPRLTSASARNSYRVKAVRC